MKKISGQRNTNLELFRVITMLLIIAHHYVVNSGVWEMIKQYPEWLHREKTVAKPIGMTMDNLGDGLTEEEKKLKQMGIDPR